MSKTGTKMVEEKEKEIRVPTKWRVLLDVFVSNAPDIQNIQLANTDGDVQFSIKLMDQGLTAAIFMEYKDILFSPFVANFAGELLVRENINRFVPLLTSLDGPQYMNIVNRYEHNRFGMDVDKGEVIFTFHVSLLQSILTEDFSKVKTKT